MSATNDTHEFIFGDDQTCKMKWVFAISASEDGPVIDDIEIIPHTTSKGTEKGCLGHPETIIALIKGRPLGTIDIEALMQTDCVRELSCGQALGHCLADIRDGKTASTASAGDLASGG